MKGLDLFCGEGGAGQGYQDAGAVTYGVDNDKARLAHYQGPTHHGDVLDVMARLLRGEAVDFTHKDGRVEWLRLGDFAFIHASPPCQGYSQGTVALPDRAQRYTRMIGVTRELLQATGLPYVIENVERALPEMHAPVLLCGRMFGLEATDDDGTRLVLDRHRLFESNVGLLVPQHYPHDRSLQVAGVYGGARRDKHEARHVRKGGYVPPSLNVLKTLIGAPWMSEKGLFLSIPPAYSRFIGEQVIDHLRSEAAA